MAENSAIEWTHHTWSPWEGCQKTGSPACEHCYAEARNARFGGGEAPNWGPHAPRRPTADSGWIKPLAWNRSAARRGVRERVFPSLCDPFDNKAPTGARVRFGQLILATPNLDWLLLTKRIGNVAAMLSEMFPDGVPANVWLGATVVTQAEADRDVPKLLATVGPRVRFLSMEPLLGPVRLGLMRSDMPQHAGWPGTDDPLGGSWWPALGDFEAEYRAREEGLPSINWIIVGGESGPGARPMHPDWARSLRDQCTAADVPFLFKQWGEWRPYDWSEDDYTNTDPTGGYGNPGARATHILNDGEEPGAENIMIPVGKKAAGRLLDGVQHDGVPS